MGPERDWNTQRVGVLVFVRCPHARHLCQRHRQPAFASSPSARDRAHSYKWRPQPFSTSANVAIAASHPSYCWNSGFYTDKVDHTSTCDELADCRLSFSWVPPRLDIDSWYFTCTT